MKSAKKLTAAIIAVVMAFGLCVPAWAAEDSGSLDNFKQSVEYPGFTDVAVDSWYYGNVKTAAEYGLVKGATATAYNPTGNVTIQEAVVMASRVSVLYFNGADTITGGGEPCGNEASWATRYIRYALDNGIIIEGDFADYTATATRSEMAHIFANALPNSSGAYEIINKVDADAIPDVASTSTYADDIYKLYRAGILGGTGEERAFAPNANVSRAETAAIVSRIPIRSQRVHFEMKKADAENGTSYNYLADGVTLSPYAGHTIYVGTATQTTGGQPRKTAPTSTATSQIKTLYGFHNYNSANQAEYDAVIDHMQTAYDKLFVGKGNEALDGMCGLSAESWDVVDDIIAGRSYSVDAWKTYLANHFPTLSTSLPSPKEQATALKLYGQYSTLVRSCQANPGSSDGVSAYDSFFRNTGSCVSLAQVQLLAADMLGIDCTTYAGDNHTASILKVNGVYFSGESEIAFASLSAATKWATYGQLTEWTSASSPLK